LIANIAAVAGPEQKLRGAHIRHKLSGNLVHRF
jgi:hypothetical protein